MQGRIENEMLINEKIQKKLDEMPEFVSEWHSLLRASKATASSRQDYVNKVHRFLEFISKDTKNITPRQLTASKTTEYYISVQTKEDKNGNIVDTSDSYQQTVYCALNSFLEYLLNHDYIKQNYMDEIKKPKNKDLDRINRNRTLLTEREFKLILHSAVMQTNPIIKSRDKAILLIFMSTGMRKEALRSINVSDIDFNDKTLVVIDKGDKTQIYKLNAKCISAINEWLEYRHNYVRMPTDALFLSNQGTRISSNGLAKVVCKYTKLALGKELRPHKLRAGYCSILYDKNPDIEFVRRSVGHSDISTTQRYIVTSGSEREQAASIIDSIL